MMIQYYSQRSLKSNEVNDMSIFKNEQENKFIQTYRLYVDEIYQYVYFEQE